MTGSYDYRLILLSVVIAFISSLAAFMFTTRVARNQGSSARAWMALGAVTMGSGIWAMHFISMLAWSLPTPMGYMLDDTALSWLIAISVSWLALDIASKPGVKRQILLGAGAVMGLGIAGMHYSGMHAMQMFPEITYNKPLLALSFGVAILSSIIALTFMFQAGNHPKKHGIVSRLLAAGLMAGGIVGTHFTGMAATIIHPNAVCTTVSALHPGLFAVVIALGICTLILIASILAIMDSRNDDQANWLLADTQDKLSSMNMLDDLTQLPNHRYFQQHLDIGIRRTSRLGTSLAVAFIRLDNLKYIKQSLDQPISDEILRIAAKRIQKTIRGCDMAAYNGNEEFLVLFEDIKHANDIIPVMERIMQSLNDSFRIDKHNISLDVRAGISLYPEHGDGEHLLTYAEAAMHRVQMDDNLGFRLFDDRLESSSYDLLETQQELRHALLNKELALYFDPRMDIVGNTITGLEVQVRWLHPVKGAIPAATFVPMAENLGLMDDITDWILEQTYRTIEELNKQKIYLPVFLAVASPRLSLPGMEQRLTNIRNKFSVATDSLTLELAESAFMQQPEHYTDILKRLPAVSLKISLENFGTCFSSLPYLQHLKLRMLKLDQSFAQELVGNQKSRAIAGAIIELAHAQNLKVVAENVRTEDERNALLGLECNEIQGFFCANPVHQSQLTEILLHHNASSSSKSTRNKTNSWTMPKGQLSVLHS